MWHEKVLYSLAPMSPPWSKIQIKLLCKGASIKYVRAPGGEGGNEKAGFCGQGEGGYQGQFGRPHVIPISEPQFF